MKQSEIEEIVPHVEIITHQYLLFGKFSAVVTDKTFRIRINFEYGYSDYAEYKKLVAALPPSMPIILRAIITKLEVFYKAHENKELWKLLHSLPSSQVPTENPIQPH